MKYLVIGLTFASLALAQSPRVSECFKVHSMIRADESHYWATWTNACSYTIDSVYVMVQFADQTSRNLADGVWGLHFIAPGAHRTIRFSAPSQLADFTSVHQRKITSDMEEAFGRPSSKPALSPIEMAAVSAYKNAVQKEEGPKANFVSTVIGDPGERQYREAPVVKPALAIMDATAASFRTDFPDPWRAVLSAQESAVSPAPHGAFVRFVSEENHLFQ
jgi:hypothetical protein